MNLPGSVIQAFDEDGVIGLDGDGEDDGGNCGDVSGSTSRIVKAHEYIREVGVEAILEALRELGELPENSTDLVYD